VNGNASRTARASAKGLNLQRSTGDISSLILVRMTGLPRDFLGDRHNSLG
jgi:hypothetical protein